VLFGVVSSGADDQPRTSEAKLSPGIEQPAARSGRKGPVIVTTPPIELEGLSESVSRVLTTSGFAAELTQSDFESQLPPSVYRTLVAHDAVLTVAVHRDAE